MPVWYEAVMWVAMDAAGREEFLAGVRVGVLSAAIGTVGQTLALEIDDETGHVRVPAGLAAPTASARPARASG